MSSRTRIAIALTSAIAFAPAAALAQSPSLSNGPAPASSTPLYGSLAVRNGAGRLVTLPEAASSVFVANPLIVMVRPASTRRLFVFGKSVGRTTVTATGPHGALIAQWTVTVGPSRYGALRIENGARTVAPGSHVVAKAEPGGTVLTGSVQTPAEAAAIANEAQTIVGKSRKIVNDLQVAEPQQVVLKVRIAQMSRSVTQQLGINWQSIGAGVSVGKFLFRFSTVGNLISSVAGGTPGAGSYGTEFPGGNLDGILNALNQDNLAHILAEPTLTALSGQTASFIDGGSFPVPVPGQNGQVTVQFQSFGVQLKFTPTVLSSGNIILNVNPTVSNTSNQNAFTLSAGGESIVVPSLTEQAANTTVVMGSGQTLAIAGLLEDTSSQTDNSVPGLGRIPLLGGMFRSDQYTRNRQELVILVTPYVARPVNNPSKFETPGQSWTPPNEFQRIFEFRQNGTVRRSTPMPSDVGFIVR